MWNFDGGLFQDGDKERGHGEGLPFSVLTVLCRANLPSSQGVVELLALSSANKIEGRAKSRGPSERGELLGEPLKFASCRWPSSS